MTFFKINFKERVVCLEVVHSEEWVGVDAAIVLAGAVRFLVSGCFQTGIQEKLKVQFALKGPQTQFSPSEVSVPAARAGTILRFQKQGANANTAILGNLHLPKFCNAVL